MLKVCSYTITLQRFGLFKIISTDNIKLYIILKIILVFKTLTYTSPITILILLSAIQNQDVEWYRALTSNLTEAEVKSLGEICLLADQRAAARESKKIEQQGGRSYHFFQL